MRQRRRIAACVVCAVVLAAAAASAQEAAENPFRPFDQGAFETAMKTAGATEAQLEAFRARVGAESPAIAADTLLQELHADYRAAVAQASAGEPAAALALAKVLTATDDRHLQAHARYHLGRVFLDADDPEHAIDVFREFLRDARNLTPLDSEVVYFYGNALAAVPMPAEAASVFAAFVQHFPQAAERYLASAMQQRAELESQIDRPLHEIADVMKGVERRIRRTDTGKETQERQKAVITKLEKIIEEIEEREKQGGGPGGNNPTSPATKSALPEGASRIGNLDKAPNVVDKWGMMKDRDRETIENDLQTKLPGRYQQLLKDYYKRLNSGGR
jgi:tetratricopeptide (TPR) repeat protein